MYGEFVFADARVQSLGTTLMTPISPACCRTSAWIKARLAMRLSVRVGNVLRQRVGPEGDAGHLNAGHVNSLFVKDSERAEALRLIELAKRWPRRGKVISAEENSRYRMGDYFGSFVQENGE